MSTVEDLQAAESERRKLAEQRLRQRISKSFDYQKGILANAMQMVIVDRLVAPKSMKFFVLDPKLVGSTGLLRIAYERKGSTEECEIHTHALGQMATFVGVPRTFVTQLKLGDLWKKELLAHIMNEFFHQVTYVDRRKQPAQFLHRLVNGELRGFLSRNYNRKLVTRPLLQAFVGACQELRADASEVIVTDVRLSLKCMLPLVFEPVRGEFVAFGVTFSNSDFGAGKTKVSGTIMRISSGTLSVLSDRMSRVHLGSVIEEDDLEVSDETLDKELQTHTSAIQDAVKALLGYDNIARSLRMIELAYDKGIPWHQLKNRLTKLLNKGELEVMEQLLDKGGDEIIDLPPPYQQGADKVPSAWWAANVLGWMASKEEDQERKQDLQQLAGEVLNNDS